MGWSWCNSETKEQGIANLLKSWVTDPEKGITMSVVAHSLRGATLWSVWERRDRDGTRLERILVCHLTSTKGGGFGSKGMDESMGPCQYNCPLTYLDMVPDPGGYATAWRAKVRAWHARQKQTFLVGRRYALIGCVAPWIRVESAKPLIGSYQGRRYTIPRPRIGALLEEDPVTDPVEGSEKANDPYIVTAAWGDWQAGVPKGMVGVFACRGGRCESGNYSPFQAYFLVPVEEYQKRDSYANGFVIDEARHQRVPDFTKTPQEAPA